MKHKLPLPAYKAGQYILVLLLLAFGWSQIQGGKIISAVSMETLEGQLTDGLDAQDYEKKSQTEIRRYLGLDPSQYESISLFRSDDALSADEMAVVRFSDPGQAAGLEDAFRSRADSQASIYEGYAPEEALKAKNAVIDVQGNTGFYYVGDNPSQMNERYLDLISGGA